MAEEKEDYIIEGEDDEQQNLPPEDDNEGDEQQGDDNDQEDSREADSDEGHDDEDREAIRERRRLERQQKKQAQKERDEQRRREIQMLKQEKEELASRLSVLERRAAGSELGQLDSAIDQTNRAAVYYKEQIKLATEAGDGATVAEATEKMIQAQRHLDHLQNIKRQAVNSSRQQETHSPIDPVLRMNAEKWVEKNSWYNPQGGDPDSRIALTVDQSMAEEGWDPRQPEYWDELDSRLRRYLPHRYTNSRTPAPAKRNSPVASGGREGGTNSNSGTWKLSAERVNAMKEAGIWEDPERRNAMIKRYKEMDKSAGR